MGVLLPADQMVDSGDRLDPHGLIGLSVRQVGEREIIGTVVDSFDNGAHQVLVIHHGKKEFLVPLVDDIITGIETDAVVIDPPPGLLDLDANNSRAR